MKKKKKALTLLLTAKLSLMPLTGSAFAKQFLPLSKEEKAKILFQSRNSQSDPGMKLCWADDWTDDWSNEWGDGWGDTSDGGWDDWVDEGEGDEGWGDWPG